ncbi:MAG: phosphatidylserine decarboxylase [Desulfuromonadales bacterium]|nr:phosphatidylserine decarboxylase [Desulfuromonadales bacterium]
MQHQYIERYSGRVVTEQLLADRMVRLLYHGVRENNTRFFKLLTSSWSSHILGMVNFDRPVLSRRNLLARYGVDRSELRDPPDQLDTPRKIFERKIRYETCRPLPQEADAVVSPADARVVIGSFRETSLLFLKEKFFSYEELLGSDKADWLRAFEGGDFAVFRLTPDKYHYNHVPVAGQVLDIYTIDGDYHSCNPSAVVSMATPYSKNRRVVTIIDTDVPRGTAVGLVAMVEVVALMIGDIVQAYSSHGYESPSLVESGMFLEKGQPKSLYRPGSSTDILIFQKERISFSDDILGNMRRSGVSSRFSHGFGRPLVETDLMVRSLIARAVPVKK